MITPPTDPQPGEIWRYAEQATRTYEAVRVVEEIPSTERHKRYLAQMLTGLHRGQFGIVFRDQLREKTDEL